MTTPPESTSPVRLDSLTGLRWWAAFFVFAYHLRLFVPYPPLPAAIAAYGHFGVTFFFVLSGFVLTWSSRVGTPARIFYWRRFSRIYPLHLVALLLAIPVFYSLSPDPTQPWVKPYYWVVLLLSLLLLQAWSVNPTVLFSGNPAAWTLSVEAFFYATHPWLMRPLVRLQKRGALWVAVGATATGFGTYGAAAAFPAMMANVPLPPLRLYEFVLGMALGWAMRQGWRLRMPLLVPVFAGGVLFFVLRGSQRFPEMKPLASGIGPYTEALVAVICAGIVVAAANADIAGRSRLLAWRPIVALGEWSYAFYLVHATIMYALLETVGVRASGGWPAAIWWWAVLTVTIAVAAGLHLGVEKPIERRLRTWQEANVGNQAHQLPPRDHLLHQ